LWSRNIEVSQLHYPIALEQCINSECISEGGSPTKRGLNQDHRKCGYPLWVYWTSSHTINIMIKSYSTTRRLYTSKNWFQALVFPRLKGCSSRVTSDLCRNPLSTCSAFTLWWPSVSTRRAVSTYLANSGFRISIFGRGSSQALMATN